MTKSGARYPFIIMNVYRSDKNGIHWWSFLDLYPKKEISLFDSFGFEGFKEFVLQNDQKVLNKILYGKDNKMTLTTLKFFMWDMKRSKTKIG